VWLVLTASWDHLGEGKHSTQLRQWIQGVTLARLNDRVYVNWMRVTVAGAAARAEAHDARAAQAAWHSWIRDGPSKSIGRHHRMSKVQTGWIPSAFGKAEPQEDGEAELDADAGDELEDVVDERTLAHAMVMPLSSQAEVDAEAVKWGAEWEAEAPQVELPWPDLSEQDPLPHISVDIARRAAHTFPPNTGLGWDKLHPRVISRCHDEAILALIRLLVLAEMLGQWPAAIGIVLVCLIPKPDGGRRPIGLLPSVVRWWMRIRLEVVRSWQAANERPFYAGPRKGAEVAAWKHAARSELAHSQRHEGICYAALLLDLVKAFERVPHEWLIAQGVRFQYPLLILRLSIRAYRLHRTLVVEGLCSALLCATRGITAGAVHATVELRLLLIEAMSQASLVMYVTITLYVDDATLEAIGPAPVVRCALVEATRIFTAALQSMRMEFSPTKNVCVASSPALARAIVEALPGLALKAARVAKALGGAISGGKLRNTLVLRKRLAALKVRKVCFRKLRRAVGARRCHAVLRTGGTSAMMYGISNTGVADSTLAQQRSAVALASVSHGSSDVDLALVIADGSLKGKADPAFPAHTAPIGKWAEAVWESWLSRPALEKLAGEARAMVGKANFRWNSVRGPAAAFVASACRLGWQVLDAFNVVTDWGISVDFRLDPPAHVTQLVTEAVWRWRWRRVVQVSPPRPGWRGAWAFHRAYPQVAGQ